MIAAPVTPIPEPVGGVDERDLMDFGAALSITLPKNENIKKITAWIDGTGEPTEGYIGKPLVRHVREWTTVKKQKDIVERLQALMYLRIIVCAATQEKEKNWGKFQSSDGYLYAFDQKKINIYKCPSRGSDYVDMDRWKAYFDEEIPVEDVKASLNKNKKINKGGINATTYAAPIEITFTTASDKAKGTIYTTNKRMIKVQDKQRDMRLTPDELNKRRANMKEQQNKLNRSQKDIGAREWTFQASSDKHAIVKTKKQRPQQVGSVKKAPGGVGVQKKVAHFDPGDDEKTVSKTKVKNTKVDYDGYSYPIGSDDIKYYDVGMIVDVWSERNKAWVDGEVKQVIKFVKTVKIKYDGKEQQFRIPNVNMVRLKY